MTDELRVVVADDSPIVCRLLKDYLEAVPGIEVAGMACNGPDTVEMVRKLRPNVLTLDIEMPEMDGLRVLERIMTECPTPVILISGVSREAATIVIRAIDLGAVDFVLKYTPGTDADPGVLREEIVAKVRAAARVRAIRSLRFPPGASSSAALSYRRGPRGSSLASSPRAPRMWPLPSRVVVIGASTGGPLALRELLAGLGSEFPGAIVIVQHLPPTFTCALAKQLGRETQIVVREAEEGDRLRPGLALVAPGDCHLTVEQDGRVGMRRSTSTDEPCPSVDATMESVAAAFGAKAVGVILSGMGDDGAKGMAAIRSAGGKTFAQDRATCVVAGMPSRAIEAGAVQSIGSPTEIASLLRMA
jgi:two-component system chemotaxis response regulator CheB